jgi:hypothetical protein
MAIAVAVIQLISQPSPLFMPGMANRADYSAATRGA